MRFYGEAVPFRNTRYYYDANVGPDNIEIYSADRAHTLYSAYKYEYVVIDGVRCGKSPALYAWYDKGKNAFVWNAVEGRELVLYEYGF
jgi:hypothetical protein